MVQKIKNFFKKYWGYFVAFVVGVFAYMGIDARGNKRANANIEQLRNQLGEYKQLNQHLADTIEELEQRLASVKARSAEAREQHSRIKQDVEQARDDAVRIGERIDVAIEHSAGIDNVTGELQQESIELAEAIRKLGQFIEKNAKEAEVH